MVQWDPAVGDVLLLAFGMGDLPVLASLPGYVVEDGR